LCCNTSASEIQLHMSSARTHLILMQTLKLSQTQFLEQDSLELQLHTPTLTFAGEESASEPSHPDLPASMEPAASSSSSFKPRTP